MGEIRSIAQRLAALPPIPNADEEAVVTVEAAGAYLGLGRSAAYDAVRRGDIPSLRIGRRYVVPTAKLRALLGLDA